MKIRENTTMETQNNRHVTKKAAGVYSIGTLIIEQAYKN